MRVLALDTTTRTGSVALVEDDRVVEERSGDPSRTHAERLPGEILALATAHGLAMADVDVFAVASGPGSFTGLRVGIATIQGLAFTTSRPLVAVSALDALAQMASVDVEAGALVAAWMDAHRREVFAALYRVAPGPLFSPERLMAIDGPTVGEPGATLARWAKHLAGNPTRFVGDGTAPHSRTILAAGASEKHILPMPLIAGTIGRMAVVIARRGETSTPAAVQPLYVRRSDAEMARNRLVGR